MRIYIMGMDGYIGWALAQYLESNGHAVAGCDNELKRMVVEESSCKSIIPVQTFSERCEIYPTLEWMDGGDYKSLRDSFQRFGPDVVVNLAQIPSAPYSMKGWYEAWKTQQNNLKTNLASLMAAKDEGIEHVVALGTMGEYGTPNVDIPEGDFDLEFRGRKDHCQFPRKPGSLYHVSKCQATNNCEYFSRTFGTNITDIMQGVVYGVGAKGVVHPTTFWADEAHGTAINRFCAQALIGADITVYGKGTQTRGFLPLRDALQCVELLCKQPAEEGEYRVVNQFDKSYSINELAETVKEVAEEMGLPEVSIINCKNPRVELDEHYYNPDKYKLPALGYKPSADLKGEIRETLNALLPHVDRILDIDHILYPSTQW